MVGTFVCVVLTFFLRLGRQGARQEPDDAEKMAGKKEAEVRTKRIDSGA